MMWSFAILVLLQWGFNDAADCSPAILNADGTVDLTATLYNCSKQMSDPELIYSYKETATSAVVVYTQVVFNNLIKINELESTMALDFYFQLSWTDPRWNISELWAKQTSSLAQNGLTIDQLVFSTDEGRLRIWLPDINFVDQVSSTLLTQTIKLRPNGVLTWLRHFMMVVVQPHFTYEDYPMDSQTLNLRFFSYSYSTDFLRLRFSSQSVSFVSAVYPDQTNVNWQLNTQWILDKDDFATYVTATRINNTVGNTVVSMTYDSALVALRAERISDGMLIRLGFPILILMVLSGLVFWAAAENRIDSTMTILLAVSALYIVVFGSIPMLGYLTSFDRYMNSMFVLLTVAVGIHQLSYRMTEKADRRPLRYVIVRILEFVGRVCIFPVAIILFVKIFPSDFVRSIQIPVLVILSLIIALIAVRDGGGVRKTFLNTMGYYSDRRKYGELHTMSEFELKFFFFYETHLKKYCECFKEDSDQDHDDDEEPEEEFSPRMIDPNKSAKEGGGLTTYVSVAARAPPQRMQPDKQGHSTPAQHMQPRDSVIFGVELSAMKEESKYEPEQQLSKQESRSSVMSVDESDKKLSKKRLKKQQIIDNIMDVERMRIQKRQSSPSVMAATTVDSIPSDPETGQVFNNPMLFKKK